MARRLIHAGGRLDWEDGQVRILLSGPGGEVSEDIRRRARAVQKRAQRAAPFRTGALRHSISVSTAYPPDGAVATITAKAAHGVVAEFGRREVRPRNRVWLHWQGDFGKVFTRYAAPWPGKPYLRPALDAARD